MARPPRDQSAGVVHLIWRGVRREPIFVDDHDRERYLELLAGVCETLGWRAPAYCLMRNHVHLMAVVTEGTLSRGMQSLGSRYAQRYNARHGFEGHLFECRYRSERVDTRSYGLELVRYLDLNPKRAGATSEVHRWRWSSYRALVGLDPPRPFHDVDWTLEQFSLDRRRAHRAYAAFVADGAERPRPLRKDMSRRDMSWGQTPGRVPNGRAVWIR